MIMQSASVASGRKGLVMKSVVVVVAVRSLAAIQARLDNSNDCRGGGSVMTVAAVAIVVDCRGGGCRC